MIVTDLKYGLETKLVEKLDIMIRRCEQKQPKKDAVLAVEGGEGEGKTNTSVAVAYYIKSKTGRDIHLFLRLKEVIDFAKSNKGKIIIWDEPGLDSLSTDHYKDINKNLIRLLMACRKNRHFFLFNFTKFYKFPEYVIVDRCIGMIHMYSRKEIEPGRFVYIRKKFLEALYNGYRVSKKRLYNKFKSFSGDMPEILEKEGYFDRMNIILNGKPHATYADYENEKDKAINSIGDKEKTNIWKSLFLRLKKKIATAPRPIINAKDLAEKLGIDAASLRRWAKLNINEEPDDESKGDEL